MALEDRLYRDLNRVHYSRVLRDAQSIIRRAVERFGGPVVVAVSGGKDSTAMAHLVVTTLERLGRDRPILLHTDSGLELRDSLPTCERLAERLGCELEVCRGADARRLKREMGAHLAERVEDELCIIGPTREALARLGAAVEFVGLRMDEAKKRRMLIGRMGPINLSKRYGCGVAWPMRSWSGADAFAHVDAHELPLHPAYEIDLGCPRHERRVSWAYDSSFVSQGSEEFLRRYDPQLYHRLGLEGILCSAR